MNALSRSIWGSALLLAAFATPNRVQANIIELVPDSHDDRMVVNVVQEIADVKSQAEQLEGLKKWLYQCKSRDLVALFGKPGGKPDQNFALPCSEPRMIGLSGIRYADKAKNKDRWEFFSIDQSAGIYIHFGINGETPDYITFYLKVDRDFVKLDNSKKLPERLAWETARLRKLVRHVEQNRRKVFVWEIDPTDEKKRSQGIEAPDPETKFKAWLKWGEIHGYRLQPASARSTTEWKWYDGKVLVARAAHGGRADAEYPLYFEKFHTNGKVARDEWGWPSHGIIRWNRTDGSLVRYESGGLRDDLWRCSAWMWRDKEGKTVRSEWDENGDGIPDLYRLGADEKKTGQPLSVAESWALNPNLIPEELRIPDQDGRKIVIRKIPEAP